MSSISDRVRDLIEASGLSQQAFAQRVGLDATKLSKSLTGTRRFTSLDLAEIAEVGGVTVDWLITGEEQPLAVAARTTGGEAGAAFEVAERFRTMRADMTTLGYPQPWRPVRAQSRVNYVKEGWELAEFALARVTEAGRTVHHGKLADLVEDVFGADVAVVPLDAGFDGLAVSSGDVKLIVLATSRVPYRQRFTLAHELGHLFLGDDQGIHLDRDVFDKAQAKDPTEQRANAFAAAFLMPEGILREAADTSGFTAEAFADLACRLSVSPSALAYRLRHLRLIEADACERYQRMTAADAARLAGMGQLFAVLVQRATKSRQPGLLVRDSYSAYEAGAATLRPYASLLGVDVDQLRHELESERKAHLAP